MTVAIPNIQDIQSNNIIIGHAELIAVNFRGKTKWALPGGSYTTSKPHAMTYARRLNTLIKVNMERYNSNLLWS